MEKSALTILPSGTVSAGETTQLSDCTSAVDNSRATELAFTVKSTVNSASTGTLTLYVYSSTDNSTYDTQEYDSWVIPNCRQVDYDAGTASFVIGETVTSASSGTATVKNFTITSGSFAGNDAAGVIYLEDISGTFANDDSLTGGTNGAAVQDGTIDAHSMVRTYYPSTTTPLYYKVKVANGDTTYGLTGVSVIATKRNL